MQYRIMVERICRNKALVPIENISDFSEMTNVIFIRTSSNQVSSLSSGIKAVIALIEVFLTWKIWEWSYDKL